MITIGRIIPSVESRIRAREKIHTVQIKISACRNPALRQLPQIPIKFINLSLGVSVLRRPAFLRASPVLPICVHPASLLSPFSSYNSKIQIMYSIRCERCRARAGGSRNGERVTGAR